MLVKATDKYEKFNLKDKELDRIPKEGEQFEVSEERYKELTKTNKYNEVFVEEIILEDIVEIEEENIIDGNSLKENEVIEVKAEEVVTKPKKERTRKKKQK